MSAMQATYRQLSGYDHLIGEAKHTTTNTEVGDIASLGKMIRNLAIANAPAMAGIANHLRGDSQLQTKYNVWHFAASNLRYRHDDQDLDGGTKEQPRTPQRSWADRNHGVDCEDYSCFIASILYAMRMPCEFHIVKQGIGVYRWSHIFPVSGGTCLDILTPFGVPADHINATMKVEVLGGVAGDAVKEAKINWLRNVPAQMRPALVEVMPYVQTFTPSGVIIWKPGAPVTDIDAMLNDYRHENLGSLGLFKRKDKDRPTKPPRGVGSAVLHVVPMMVLGRNAFLELVKLNTFRLAQKLRLAYLPEEKAAKSKLDLDEWRKLRDRKPRLERTWKNLGGDIDALKKAIAKGAHVDVSNLAEAGTAVLVASATPVLVGITAALSGIDFKKMTAKSDQPEVAEGQEALGEAAGGFLKKLIDKKKNGDAAAAEELKLMESVADASAPTDEEAKNQPKPTNLPTPDDKSNTWIWWAVGGGVVLLLGGGAYFVFRESGESSKKVKRVKK